MSIDLLQLSHSMFRKKYERKSLGTTFTPYFYRVIGVEDEGNYNNILRTLKEKCDEYKEQTIIFDGSIPLSGEMELINYIFNELGRMNINKLSNEEITIFNDGNINNCFLKALEYVVDLAIEKENFFNDNIRNNFITKIIVWVYTWAKNIDYTAEINPKCIYYGNIGRHEVYFLILLYLMGFDVLYLNPLKDEYFSEIDSKGLSILEKKLKILPVESFEKRASMGKVIDNVETITKQLQREIDDDLFTDTMLFKPWQFRNGYTKSILLDTIIDDIYMYWNEPAKVRAGFWVKGSLVSVPCFFMKIDGRYENIQEYQNLIKFCIESPNTLFFNSAEISKEMQVTGEMYSLMFAQLSDGTFDIEEIKKNEIYRFSKYSNEVQNYLLNKFNETIKDTTLLNLELNREEILNSLCMILNLNENIVRIIDNFDFVFNVPKIVIFLDKEEKLSKYMMFLLAYLHKAAIDIVIFNPSGLFNMTSVIKKEKFNSYRLDEVRYDTTYKEIMNYKTGFFSRILNK